ncbi:hypothetical protein EVAR_7461_1 [Eumeta japonica]|uniref:Uncharacterized protein n=1 Tax=Eumeta variegata TaxID=151549 RepID=A0A4C2A4W1_EUMVA|nr:hypothetical protein EVAR_7461_1 [Eumeta japonica]
MVYFLLAVPDKNRYDFREDMISQANGHIPGEMRIKTVKLLYCYSKSYIATYEKYLRSDSTQEMVYANTLEKKQERSGRQSRQGRTV